MNEWAVRLSTVNLFALAVSAIAFTFLLVSQKMLSQYEQLAGRAFARSDSRWRFYSIFAAMMLSVGTLALGYAVFAKDGFYTALAAGNLSAWMFVMMGWVPLPALLLELALAQHIDALGFTRLYEGNIQRLAPNSFLRRWAERFTAMEQVENDGAGESTSGAGILEATLKELRSRLSFLMRWLLIYAVAPALGVHLRINANTDSDFRGFGRNVQMREDWIVLFVSLIWIFLAVFISVLSVLQYLSYNLTIVAQFATWLVLFFLGIIHLVAAAIGFDILTQRTHGRPVDKIAVYALVFLLLAGVFDIVIELWARVPASSPETFFEKSIARFVVIWQWFGGIAPIVLLVFLTGAIRRFLEDIARSREGELERVNAAMAANLIGLGLHHFGNKFSVVRALTSEIIKQSAAPPTEPERQRQVWNSLSKLAQIAEKALEEADHILGGLKRDIRRTATEHDSWFNITEAIREMVPERLTTPAGQATQISLQTPPGEALEVLLDRGTFLSVVDNFVQNALAALDEVRQTGQGFLGITLDYEAGRSYPLTLVIRDNGAGMGPDVQERIYDPFFTTRPQGSGMGLYVARKFIENLGGELSCRSATTDAHRGTEFRIGFPPSRVRRRAS